MNTNENSYVPWDTAIADLTYMTGQYSYPVSTLLSSAGLANACVDLILDIGPCGLTTYTGQDGSTSAQRL